MVKRLHARRDRGRARRRLQPLLRGRRARAHGVASAASTTASTTASSRTISPSYVDYTGCGNTLDATHPQVLKLVTDSLRYWVEEMHVDGFRFDLAPALARGTDGDVDRIGAFFAVVHQDPVLSRIKLIAEPWDVGAGGYQVGNFPILWSEWNGRFRDTVRSFWRGDRRAIARPRATASRARAISFADDGRHPHASINLVTAHDGFTLRDLVSYEQKHNEANGEDNRDGLDENLSQNCGVEGETTDAARRSRAAARSRAACSRRCSCRRASRCSRWATSCGARSAGTTTRTATTRSSPGSTGAPGADERGDARARARAGGAAQAAPGLPAARLPARGALGPEPRARTSPGYAPTARR